MIHTSTCNFWIFESNLEGVLLLFSFVAKYDFDDSDLEAVRFGLISTSQERKLWWSYKLMGEKVIELGFAREEENHDIIFMQATFDNIFLAEVVLTIFAVQNFLIQPRH